MQYRSTKLRQNISLRQKAKKICNSAFGPEYLTHITRTSGPFFFFFFFFFFFLVLQATVVGDRTVLHSTPNDGTLGAFLGRRPAISCSRRLVQSDRDV